MRFRYEIKANGLLMDTAPTLKSALAVVTKRFHMHESVTVEKGGLVLWNSKK